MYFSYYTAETAYFNSTFKVMYVPSNL